MSVEPLVVILLTYERTEYTLRTIAAARKFLRYPDIRWYIADDGSRMEHLDAVRDALRDERVCGEHWLVGGSYGASANRAWDFSHRVGRLTLWLEDDWELTRELDVRPYADLLMDDDRLGMVRMGYLNLGMKGMTFGHRGTLYWWLKRPLADGSEDAYVFTGHPSMRHWRMREWYGPYTEGRSPGETELDYAWQFITKGNGPGIVWPADLGSNGAFGHIGQVQAVEFGSGVTA